MLAFKGFTKDLTCIRGEGISGMSQGFFIPQTSQSVQEQDFIVRKIP